MAECDVPAGTSSFEPDRSRAANFSWTPDSRDVGEWVVSLVPWDACDRGLLEGVVADATEVGRLLLLVELVELESKGRAGVEACDRFSR